MRLRSYNDRGRTIVPRLRTIKRNLIGIAELELESLLQTRHDRFYGSEPLEMSIALKIAMHEGSKRGAGVCALNGECRYRIRGGVHRLLSPQRPGKGGP